MSQFIDCLPRPAPTASVDDDDLVERIAAEFEELPGLTLTLAQAARLFDVDRPRCERALGSLVKRRVLCTDGQTFARAGWNPRQRRCA